ncbi:MAG: histidine kinase dimerization/phosphoacceptor domain -containing protein [Devosia sp.]
MVIALAIGLIALILAIFGFLCWQGYGTTLDNARVKAQTAADIIADDTEWALGGSLSALHLVANLGPAALDPANRPAIDAALKQLPADTRLTLYNAAGDAVDATGTSSIAAESYFEPLKLGQEWVILPVGADPSDIVIAQRLGGTEFAGVAVLAIPMTLLQSFAAPQKLGDGSTVIINRDDGWMVGRYPPLPGPLDVSKTSAYWDTISTNDKGIYTTVSPLDAVNRIVGFRHLKGLGLIAFATISQDAAIGALWTSIIIVSWLIGPIALMLLAFALIIARILRQSERTQAKLAAAVAHNEVLFREIHHRVKNNLQSVGSLLQMQPIDKAIKTDMGQRIAAMSAVHEHIYRSNNFSTVMVKSYLETLIENIRRGGDPRVTVAEQIDDLSVDKDAATPLGLILNEVVANAFKHAFPDGRDGLIAVTLVRDSEGRGNLTVEDNGVGFDPAKPAKGIGQRLIRALAEQLGGESKVETAQNGGARFVLTFPLAKSGG